MTFVYILIGLLAVVILYAIVIYIGLVRLRVRVTWGVERYRSANETALQPGSKFGRNG